MSVEFWTIVANTSVGRMPYGTYETREQAEARVAEIREAQATNPFQSPALSIEPAEGVGGPMSRYGDAYAWSRSQGRRRPYAVVFGLMCAVIGARHGDQSGDAR